MRNPTQDECACNATGGITVSLDGAADEAAMGQSARSTHFHARLSSGVTAQFFTFGLMA